MSQSHLPFHHVTRGGQLLLHALRMFFQVLRQWWLVCLVAGLLTIAGSFYLMTDADQRYYGWKWVYACIKNRAMGSFAGSITVVYDGVASQQSVKALIHHPPYRDNARQLGYLLLDCLPYGPTGFLVMALLMSGLFRRISSQKTQDTFIRGNRLVTAKALRAAIERQAKKAHGGQTSGLTLAGLPVPHEQETAHFLLAGSPGTGKSLALRELLYHVRQQQQRAVVYDVAGDFIRLFYRPDKDIILNPFDTRSARWDIWCDCQRDYDYVALAEALIPEEKTADFFVQAARMVLASMAEQLAKQSRLRGQTPSMQDLIELVLRCDMDVLMQIVRGTDAASVLNEEAGKMATSVRGVMATYTRPLKYLRADGDRFSLRDWVRRDDDDGWVFISCNEEQKALLKPLITVWFNTVASTILSLSPCRDRRIYLAIDELPSLNKLPSLAEYLAQGRKYGGCGLLGFQSFSQMEMLWGREGARTLTGLCSSWLIYRCEEKTTAQWASDNLYQQEVMESSESLSYGAHSVRDGVSINPQKKERVLVTPTEIMNLNNCTGYLRLGRGLPVAKVEVQRLALPTVAEAFCPMAPAGGDTPVAGEASTRPGDSEALAVEPVREPTVAEANTPAAQAATRSQGNARQPTVEVDYDQLEI